MTPEDARLRLSDYLEDALSPAERADMDETLAAFPLLAAELSQMERLLSVLHALPPREPSLDLWREFLPHMTEHARARRLGFVGRLRAGFQRVRAEASAGLILWTHAVAARAHARLERYLLNDPLPPVHR